jgi:DNA primase
LIPKDTIDDIFQAARIEEVVGEFVHLKKRGVNMLGNCPFHDEKTPSFTVSPAKGIYKCFGCGVGGNSVNFVMAHEHFTYPEALRYLANKFGIEVEEEEVTPEMAQEQSEKESMYVVANYAQQHFIENLHDSNEGKAIGLSYFKERGFSSATIDKFKLGYAIDSFDAFTGAATTNGYKQSFLLDSGLTKDKNGKQYDGYRGRVMFPIHNLSGRPIGFGGRTLKTDKKVPKYVNSPQNAIYDKSKVLYGLFTAKKSIIQNDNCFLVEGYTDVISMYQAGVENVVSSSGTSLTTDQIRLISRFTKNITILYDGDVAGIKASFRGIDMILEQGMNVKVVLFPDGEDPDSFAKKSVPGELEDFIKDNAKDFIVFKTDLLYAETEGDPIKKAKLIHDIVDSITLIPDDISRAVYIKECSRLLDIEEHVLIGELNKGIRKKQYSNKKEGAVPQSQNPVVPFQQRKPTDNSENDIEGQEKNIIRLLLMYSDKTIPIDVDGAIEDVVVAAYLVYKLQQDEIELNDLVCQKIIVEYANALNEEIVLDQQHFLNHESSDISALTIDLVTSKYELHDWESKLIYVETEDHKNKLKRSVEGALHSYLEKRVRVMWQKNQEKLKENPSDSGKVMALLKEQKRLTALKGKLSASMGRIVVN